MLSYIFCLEYSWQYRQSEWILRHLLIDDAFGIVAVTAFTAFAAWVASVCLHFRLSVCSVAKLVFERLFSLHLFV